MEETPRYYEKFLYAEQRNIGKRFSRMKRHIKESGRIFFFLIGRVNIKTNSVRVNQKTIVKALGMYQQNVSDGLIKLCEDNMIKPQSKGSDRYDIDPTLFFMGKLYGPIYYRLLHRFGYISTLDYTKAQEAGRARRKQKAAEAAAQVVDGVDKDGNSVIRENAL